ncbi:MAG: nitrogenase iron protein NifH [Raoultibacter sp.]
MGTQALRQIAFYGKGGIGKSTTSQNIAAALGQAGRSLLVVGCDPKADCTSLLTGEFFQETVLEKVRSQSRNAAPNTPVDGIMHKGFAGIACVESGGPEPGVGCAGRGIICSIELIERQGIIHDGLDYVFYDVLGDVVCGGFAMPIREGKAQEIYLVTSGEMMSLYAANNIAMGILKFAASGRTRLGGVICNCRNVPGEIELVQTFAKELGTAVIGVIPRDNIVQVSELNNQTVIQYASESNQADAYRKLACALEANELFTVPRPLTKERLRELALSIATR